LASGRQGALGLDNLGSHGGTRGGTKRNVESIYNSIGRHTRKEKRYGKGRFHQGKKERIKTLAGFRGGVLTQGEENNCQLLGKKKVGR